MKNVNNP